MAQIISVTDLPASLQGHELVNLWVDGANGAASRVAPCLLLPVPADWAAATSYALGDRVKLPGGSHLRAIVAGTSAGSAPTAPESVGDSVVDGSVKWQRIPAVSDQLSEARLVLVGAVSRWADAGSGAFSQVTTGPFGVTTDSRQKGGYRLWPSEIEQLQDICEGEGSEAFSVDTVPAEVPGYWSSPYWFQED